METKLDASVRFWEEGKWEEGLPRGFLTFSMPLDDHLAIKVGSLRREIIVCQIIVDLSELLATVTGFNELRRASDVG